MTNYRELKQRRFLGTICACFSSSYPTKFAELTHPTHTCFRLKSTSISALFTLFSNFLCTVSNRKNYTNLVNLKKMHHHFPFVKIA